VSGGLWITGVGAATRQGPTLADLERGLREPSEVGDHTVGAAGAAAALVEALEMAGLGPRLRVNAALFVGCTWAGLDESELAVESHVNDQDPDDVAWSRHGSDHILARLTRSSGVGGLSLVVSAAGGGSAEALELGARWLVSSASPLAVVGGVQLETRVGQQCFADRVGVDPAGCRPHAPDRRGTTLATGAGFLVLERAAHAAQRGATPLASLEAIRMQSGGNALARLLQRAQADAPDLWLLHGSGGVAEDAEEAGALKTVLGEPAPGLAASKALVGHTQGAAAALDAVIAALALRGGFFPCLEPGAGLSVVSAERLVPRSASVLCTNLLGRAWALHLRRVDAEPEASESDLAPLPEVLGAPSDIVPIAPPEELEEADPDEIESEEPDEPEGQPNPFASDFMPVEPPEDPPEEAP